MLFYNNLSLKYVSYKRESGVNSSLIILTLLLTCEPLLKFTSCGMNYHPYSYSFSATPVWEAKICTAKETKKKKTNPKTKQQQQNPESSQ